MTRQHCQEPYQTTEVLKTKKTPPQYTYIEQLLKEKVKGRRVLDIGCAEGFLCYLARKHGAESAIGIEKSAYRIKRGMKYLPGSKFVKGSIMDNLWVVKDKDIIIMSRVLYYLTEIEINKLFNKIEAPMLLIRGRNDHPKKYQKLKNIAELVKQYGYKPKILKDDWVICIK